MANAVRRPRREAAGTAPSGLLERTLAVLELLSVNARGLQLYEIAERLGIPRSATHRVLTSLAAHGYVRQERHQGAYTLTAKVASLAFTFLAGSGITDLAQPILDRLSAECGELVRMAMVDGRSLVWVAKSQGAQFGLRYDPDMGQVARLSCSASGIAWLSCLPEDEALTLVEKQGYGSRADYGPRAPQNARQLMRYVRSARKRGFALVIQTFSPWMNTIAAPIRSPATGEITGTVSVAGPYVRLTEERMLAFAPTLLQAAHELSHVSVSSPAFGAGRSGPRSNFFASSDV